MVKALLLICALGTPQDQCTEANAEVQRVEVPMTLCGMALQTVLAGQAGDRAEGGVPRLVCPRH